VAVNSNPFSKGERVTTLWFFIVMFGLGALIILVPFRAGETLEERFAWAAALLFDTLVFLIGWVAILFGRSRLDEEQRLEDFPPSAIRSVAMGRAQLTGKAVWHTPLVSTLSKTPCVWNRYSVSEEKRGSPDQYEVISHGCSKDLFFLDDGTGRLLVDPTDADLVILKQKTWFEGFTSPFPLASRRRKYHEDLILPGTPLLVYGMVEHRRDAGSGEDMLVVCEGDGEEPYLISDRESNENRRSFAVSGVLWILVGAGIVFLGLLWLLKILFVGGIGTPWGW
jgi:hypothetical protein